jgi:hypothetical protein
VGTDHSAVMGAGSAGRDGGPSAEPPLRAGKGFGARDASQMARPLDGPKGLHRGGRKRETGRETSGRHLAEYKSAG